MLNSTVTTNLTRTRLFLVAATSIRLVLNEVFSNVHGTFMVRSFGICWTSADVHIKLPFDVIKGRMKQTSFCTSRRPHTDVQGGRLLVPSDRRLMDVQSSTVLYITKRRSNIYIYIYIYIYIFF